MKRLRPALGLLAALALWELVPLLGLVEESLLPRFSSVLAEFPVLLFERGLVANLAMSLARNVGGYGLALAMGVPLGLFLGAFVPVREAFLPWLSVLRYVPLASVTSVFIANFGIGEMMKVQFLAFGIFVYILPTTVVRYKQVPRDYVAAMQTLGASRWQLFRHVHWPVVESGLTSDVKVLTAIGWTYIVIVEALATLPGTIPGIGRLTFVLARNTPAVYACVLVIMAVGLLQDKLCDVWDRFRFPHKYVPLH